MRLQRDPGAGFFLLIFVSIVCFAASTSFAQQLNSWTKPTSGNWEEQAYWSLGVLPDATQDIQFNNAGWKALAIGAQTAQNFPQSMSVKSLAVGAPDDSYNTLLMNFSGFERATPNHHAVHLPQQCDGSALLRV